MPIIDIIGWLGSALVVFAYAMNMFGRMKAESLPYYLLNISGSACLIVNTYYHHAIPSAVVNVIWVGLAVWAMVRPRGK
ncbi:CBU_0592 family membrane protein [Dinghuibacter silviterrae]|uniref:CBU-0592-like domain-containing protein n=1 Tax=Dinghuibacter silviterrae TaxID=1539049 RepID=A0A4R8DFA1_9BACT|nr:hypothetical protein [Dinghuibacter silviterrae]TDW96135.1 hypothetical protein EDB95_3958 [Dinghuibacter silviterrae]